jgi:hypothetical protein
MTISGWVFMISVGFNAAASVRVSNELGAGNPKSAYFSVWVVTALSALIAVILSIVILCLRNYVSYLFTEGEVVSNAVADLCPLLAVTLILNGIQPVLSDGSGAQLGWSAHVGARLATRVRIPRVTSLVECGTYRPGFKSRFPCHVPRGGRRLIYHLVSIF